MIPPLDPFAQKFDSIDVDPANAPARAATDDAAPDEPGFYLLDDAGGRFVIDRDIGVVSLADEALLETERGTTHAIRMRVIEPSGARYELDMQLRITGRVPQMVGAEEFAAIAGLTDETVLTATRVPVLVTETTPPAAAAAPAAVEPPRIEWTRFAVARGHLARLPRSQPRRSFIAPDLPATNEPVSLAFEGLPAAFSAHLPWSL